ncbi:MAG: protein translocase subunit SecF [Aggregatilineales bacterium]
MFNIVQRRRWFFLFSGVIIVAGLIAMGISIATYPQHTPLRLSIDFLGGSLFEVQFKPIDASKPTTPITEAQIASAFSQFNAQDVLVQKLQDPAQPEQNHWQVRSGFIDDTATNNITDTLNKTAAPLNLQIDVGARHVDQVSPTIGAETTRAALIAVIVASIVVLGWIVFAFRQVSGAFRYGACAVLAMIHDVLVMTGIMSIMGLVFKWEADALFLTALLTVVGYSVQDTIVVFDRIRENAARHRGEPYEMIINRSILETLQRSFSMQLVVGFVMLSLVLLGGESIRQFVAILLIGLLSGTYSSTFTAIPLLVAWDKGQLPLVRRFDSTVKAA